MAILEVSRRGFKKNYQTINQAVANAINGDTIVLNKDSYVLDSPINITTSVTIKSANPDQIVTINTSSRQSGFIMQANLQGNVTFENINLVCAEQSVGIQSLSESVRLKLVHCNLTHSQENWYPALVARAASLTLNSSNVDSLNVVANRFVATFASLGDYFGQCVGSFNQESIVQSQHVVLESVGIQNLSLIGLSINVSDSTKVVKSTANLEYVTLGANVLFSEMNYKLNHVRLCALPMLMHNSKPSAALLGNTVSSLILSANANVTMSDVSVITDVKESVPRFRAFAIQNSTATLNVKMSQLNSANSPSVVTGGTIMFENVADANDWTIQGDLKTSNRNSQSNLFKVVQHKTDGSVADRTDTKSSLEKLDELTGLTPVKERVKQLVATAKVNAMRKARGVKSNNDVALHMCFLGDPGTGKTTVARLVGQALYEEGVLKSTKFVEARQADLVGQHLGETAPKTRALVESALDGILFIDEAYELGPDLTGGSNADAFNAEAVTELIAQMDNHKDRLVVIMAGYTQDMLNFMRNGNPGLRSRINNMIEFPNYSLIEMKKILRYQLKKTNTRVASRQTVALLDRGLEQLVPKTGKGGGNGRFIRNYVQKIDELRDLRLSNSPNFESLTNRQLEVANEQDVKEAVKILDEQFEIMR